MAEEKKKSALAAMMAGADKEKDEAEAPTPDEEDSEGLSTAADEVFDALKSDDREAFKVALKSYVEMC